MQDRCHPEVMCPGFGSDPYADSLRSDLHTLTHTVERLICWAIAPNGLNQNATLAIQRSDAIDDLITATARVVAMHNFFSAGRTA